MKRNIKLVILWTARAIGLFHIARLLTRRGFHIIGWHGVSLKDEHLRIPLYSVSQDTLRKRLDHLRKCFRVVSLDEIFRQRASGQLNVSQVVLTFDDGLYNFAASAVPVLKEFGLPVTVYVVSSTFHNVTIAHTLCIRDMCHLTRCKSAPGWFCNKTESLQLQPLEERERSIQQLINRFKELPPEREDQFSFVKKLAVSLEVDFEEILQQRVWNYMSAEEIRLVSKDGFAIQNHTHTHINVVERKNDVTEETVKCRKLIEELTGKPAQDFCYPSGFWEKKTWESLQEAGMRSAVTCNPGVNLKTTPTLALRRLIDNECATQLEFEFSMSGLRWLIHILLHPRSLAEPSEKKTENSSLF